MPTSGVTLRGRRLERLPVKLAELTEGEKRQGHEVTIQAVFVTIDRKYPEMHQSI